MSPKQKKRVVKDAAERGLCSLRRACSYLSLSWSTFSYRPKQASKKAQRLAERIVALSWEHPRYGYRRIRALLVKEGWTTSRKFVQAVRRSEGLQVKPPKKRRPRQGISTGPPTKANGRNHVWSWDFVHDRTDNGGPLKMITLIDEYTRKCLDIRVARQLTSTDVLSVLSEAIEEEGAPSYIRSDNGSVPRSEATTCEAIHCSSRAAVVVRQKDQGDLYRSGQSLATERSDTSTSESENNKWFH